MISRDLNQLQKDKRELEEAIAVGKIVRESLAQLEDKLNSARNWGIWDLLGGKLISNIGKHSAIDAANEIAYRVKGELKAFEKELNDINGFSSLEINLSGFTTFADFFFDGIFVDFFVQSKINDARKNTLEVQNNVDNIVRGLEDDLDRINNLLNELK